MKTTLLFIFSLMAFFLSDQSFAQIAESGTTTRAVVIGISDYQDDKIPDLKYADKDAEAFASYLQSEAGGKLPDENIKLLINQQATMAAVASQLDWLVEESAEGDKAIIYFSGHGDVEAKTARQPGFLLTYDSPPKIYIAGAYPLFYLQLIIETLSSDKNVQTIVITDACRSGKLAGSEIGGTQATAANLAKQYANEIKILSCQPDEFSLEGEQWGGGRGVFSYHLIEGLIGLADKNDNYQVNLLELENYLESTVPEEVAPQSQIPMTLGSKGTKVAYVNEGVLAELKSLKERQLPTLAAIETKGIEESLLTGVDSLLEQKYEDFIVALESDNLLDAQHGKPSADQLYQELIEEESLADLHRLMTRQLATALQDDAQQAINNYLLTNPTEMQKRWEGDTTYAQYPRYLQRAAELLGEKHYMYKYLTAKQYYFEGLNMRLQLDEGTSSGSYEEAIKKIETALTLEDRAAYFYNELGVLFTRLRQHENAVSNYQQAIDLAPEWGLPHVNLCLEYFYNNDQSSALEIGQRAIELMPDYPQMYNLQGWVHANFYSYADRSNWTRRGVELKTDFYYSLDWFSTFSERNIKFKKAIVLLEKAIEIDSNYVAGHLNLGPMYRQTRQYDKAVFHIRKAIELDSINKDAYFHLGQTLVDLRRFEEAEAAFDKGCELSLGPDFHDSSEMCPNKGWLYLVWGKYDQAKAFFLKSIELNPSRSGGYRQLGGLYALEGDLKKAEWYYLKALELNDRYPVSYHWAGSTLKALNRYEDAEWCYLKANEKFPDYKEAINQLISIYYKTGQHELAEQWQEKMIENSPDDPFVYLAAGEDVYLDKQPEKAEAFFQKAKELAINDPLVSSTIGHFYMTHDVFELSKSYLEHSIAIDSTQIRAYIILSDLLFMNGQMNEALAILDKGIPLQKTAMGKGTLIVQKSYNHYFNGDADNTIKYAQEAELTRSSYRGLTFLAQKLKEKDYPTLKVVLAQLMKVFPYEMNAHYLNCRIHIHLGDTEQALKSLEKAIDLGQPYKRVVSDPELEPIRKSPIYQQIMRQYYPEKYDDLGTFEINKEEPLYYPENCLLLADYYESEGEFERAKFLRAKAAELEIMKK